MVRQARKIALVFPWEIVVFFFFAVVVVAAVAAAAKCHIPIYFPPLCEGGRKKSLRAEGRVKSLPCRPLAMANDEVRGNWKKGKVSLDWGERMSGFPINTIPKRGRGLECVGLARCLWREHPEYSGQLHGKPQSFVLPPYPFS